MWIERRSKFSLIRTESVFPDVYLSLHIFLSMARYVHGEKNNVLITNTRYYLHIPNDA